MPICADPSFISILFCVSTFISLACGQRLVGVQGMLPLGFSFLVSSANRQSGCQINDTLWLDGGRYVNPDGSTSTKGASTQSGQPNSGCLWLL